METDMVYKSTEFKCCWGRLIVIKGSVNGFWPGVPVYRQSILDLTFCSCDWLWSVEHSRSDKSGTISLTFCLFSRSPFLLLASGRGMSLVTSLLKDGDHMEKSPAPSNGHRPRQRAQPPPHLLGKWQDDASCLLVLNSVGASELALYCLDFESLTFEHSQ